MKVVLADDSALSRRLMEATLSRDGHAVTSVADGEEAVAAFARISPPLVILDWLMPNVDGLEACRRIRALPGGADAFVLMITARDSDTDLTRILDGGVDDYLSKPISADALRARLAIAERRIALETQRREAEEELARARWLAGIGETTIAVEHEINNPLAALLGSVSLLQMSNALEKLSAEDRESVDVITKQARRIAAVVKRLSKLQNPRSVEYLRGSKMIDLSPGNTTEGDEK